ncbi:MAG: NAD-dependent epimerase/dehydratase family protein [Bacteroidetes bacterium]|nr:MAG: NAD-dependent epimerase/dehydratase family protein [Bacteroidota bacterium]
MARTLIIGAGGQIGIELVEKLVELEGQENIIATDIKPLTAPVFQNITHEILDALDAEAVFKVVKKHQVNTVYLLAAVLSATAENNPKFSWDLNMNTLINVLELAKDGHVKKVFWPSSIAVFGPSTPKQNVPQTTITEPNTIYGISKLAGERWCEYYNKKYQVDVRSIRYPGLIGYKSLPGGGTTDYAVDIFYHAKQNKPFISFLSPGRTLPMMMMEDAIEGTIRLMNTEASRIRTRSSYNIAGVSFSPQEIYEEILKHNPKFYVEYKPDYRDEIAKGWPQSIDDSVAASEWGWEAKYNTLPKLVNEMWNNIKT